jgi:hypothetical protein
MRKKANAYAAIQVLVLVAVLFMGYWLVMPIFGNLYSRFTDDVDFTARYNTEEACHNRGYWNADTGVCSQLGVRAQGVMENQRRAWLIVPFIFAIGLIIWYWSVAGKKDYQQHGGL